MTISLRALVLSKYKSTVLVKTARTGGVLVPIHPVICAYELPLFITYISVYIFTVSNNVIY